MRKNRKKIDEINFFDLLVLTCIIKYQHIIPSLLNFAADLSNEPRNLCVKRACVVKLISFIK